jgi:hypothetical protein
LDKFFYDARSAHAEYRRDLVDYREGINLTTKERDALGAILAPLLNNGQSVHQILSAHPETSQSERTLYSYIESGVFKPLGVNNSFMFTNVPFMFGFLHQDKTSQSMAERINWLQERLGAESFSKLFPLILTDRGVEFEKIKVFELDALGATRLNIFYSTAEIPSISHAGNRSLALQIAKSITLLPCLPCAILFKIYMSISISADDHPQTDSSAQHFSLHSTQSWGCSSACPQTWLKLRAEQPFHACMLVSRPPGCRRGQRLRSPVSRASRGAAGLPPRPPFRGRVGDPQEERSGSARNFR